jgi:hypothetical protein
MLRNRLRQRHFLELGHTRVNKRKQNARVHVKKSHGADKSRMRSAIAAHTLRPTENTVLIARMQTALAGNNSRLWNVAGRATNALIADRRHQMRPMICQSLDFEVSVYEWPRGTQTALRLAVSSPCENNVRVLFYFI